MTDPKAPKWTEDDERRSQNLARKFHLGFYLYRSLRGWRKRFWDGNGESSGPVTTRLWMALQQSDTSFMEQARRTSELEALLKSWLACMRDPRPWDWEQIVKQLIEDTEKATK